MFDFNERPYQVVTWSDDIGSDEKMDFDFFHDAVEEAKKYCDSEQYAAVYDRSRKRAYVVFGDLNTQVFADWVAVEKFEYTKEG